MNHLTSTELEKPKIEKEQSLQQKINREFNLNDNIIENQKNLSKEELSKEQISFLQFIVFSLLSPQCFYTRAFLKILR